MDHKVHAPAPNGGDGIKQPSVPLQTSDCAAGQSTVVYESESKAPPHRKILDNRNGSDPGHGSLQASAKEHPVQVPQRSIPKPDSESEPESEPVSESESEPEPEPEPEPELTRPSGKQQSALSLSQAHSPTLQPLRPPASLLTATSSTWLQPSPDSFATSQHLSSRAGDSKPHPGKNHRFALPGNVQTLRDDPVPRLPGEACLNDQPNLRSFGGHHKELRLPISQDDSEAQVQVFHCVEHRNRDRWGQVRPRTRTYLSQPFWNVSGERVCLESLISVADPEEHLRRHLKTLFVVYNHYLDPERDAELMAALRQGTELPRPRPTRQTILIVSRMLETDVQSFLEQQPAYWEEFPGFNVQEPMPSPYLWWYRYRGRAHQNTENQSLTPEFRCLTQWIDDNYSEIYARADDHRNRGVVSHSSFPFLFRCDDVLVAQSVGEKGSITAYLAESPPRLYTPDDATSDLRIKRRQRVRGKGFRWAIDTWSYAYDGTLRPEMKTIYIHLDVNSSEQEVKITALEFAPISFHDRTVRDQLRRRGMTFWACLKRKLVTYKAEGSNEVGSRLPKFMIDFETYKGLHSEPRTHHSLLQHPLLSGAHGSSKFWDVLGPKQDFNNDDKPEEPELLLLPNQVIGFNLRLKTWEFLEVDNIVEVEWNMEAFRQLVVSDHKKELIKAIVTDHLRPEQSTDIISSKGNGLIMLLHGPPGTGKTLTAESVAEFTKRPLYTITCGDIGTDPKEVEKYLHSVFHLAKVWDCVLLLDEAEVFLEQRTTYDLARNVLVSVFLRILEYFDGILILTSNRVGTFDEAFKSRIQVAIRYEPLTKMERREIWCNFLRRLESLDDGNIDFDDIDIHLDDLVEYKLNGREIRNSITTARQLAKFKRQPLDYLSLKQVIEVTGKFNLYQQAMHPNSGY